MLQAAHKFYIQRSAFRENLQFLADQPTRLPPGEVRQSQAKSCTDTLHCLFPLILLDILDSNASLAWNQHYDM